MKAPQVEQCSHIERLPAELYVQLLGYMEPRYGVLLSLTCKKLWSMVSLKSNRVLHDLRRCEHLAARIDFLDLLEKDSPRLIRCTVCMVLHKRQPHEGKLRQRYSWDERKCAKASGTVGLGDAHFMTTAHIGLSRETAELVLRAHSHSAEHGLPTSILRLKSEGYAYGEIRTLVNFEWEGRIYDRAAHETSEQGKLLDALTRTPGSQRIGPVRDRDLPNGTTTPRLLVRTRYRIEVDTEWSITPQIKSTEIQGCGHNHDHERSTIIATVSNVIKYTDEGKVSPSSNASSFQRCSLCPTDMEVVACRVPGECFISVIVEAWRDLGGRGKHTESEWQRQSTGYITSADPFRRAAPYALGQRSLKEVFNAAELK